MSTCVDCGELSPCSCCVDPLTEIPDAGLMGNLVQSLIPCVDSVRDLYTCLGARAYRVDLVRTRWSGGRRGLGVEELIVRQPILPTPRIGNLSELAIYQRGIGGDEAGILEVSEISASFTEDQLTGLGADGCPVPKDEQFYWEVTLPASNGNSIKRRFVPTSPPNLNPTGFQWTINLRRAYEDRTRVGGDPRA